jgi:hypothetical protein
VNLIDAPRRTATIERVTIQEIQRLREARPFEPFRVFVADGNTYDVRHPKYIAQSASGRMIVVALPDDSFITLDLLLVTAIQKPIPRLKQKRRRAA